MTTETSGSKLSARTKVFYGVGDVGNALVNSALQFFLLIFYTDAALLAPAVVGSALLIGKIWDAINDPLFGWVSDRTGSKRFGKRRVYMIFGAIPLGVSIALLWFVPRGLQPVGVFLWVAFSAEPVQARTAVQAAIFIALGIGGLLMGSRQEATPARS